MLVVTTNEGFFQLAFKIYRLSFEIRNFAVCNIICSNLIAEAFNIKSTSIADKVLRIVKYVLLFFTFYMTMTASELFCKNFDPYYATATGFKGEITLWMSIITVSLVVIPGLLVDRFWCKYICPLGAISNSLKFWVWLGVRVHLLLLTTTPKI